MRQGVMPKRVVRGESVRWNLYGVRKHDCIHDERGNRVGWHRIHKNRDGVDDAIRHIGNGIDAWLEIMLIFLDMRHLLASTKRNHNRGQKANGGV